MIVYRNKKSKRGIRPQNYFSDEEHYETERVESVRYNVKFHYHECLINSKAMVKMKMFGFQNHSYKTLFL